MMLLIGARVFVDAYCDRFRVISGRSLGMMTLSNRMDLPQARIVSMGVWACLRS